MRSEIATFGLDFVESGSGIRFLICERVERHLTDPKRKVNKKWRDDPRLFVLEVENQMKDLDGSIDDFVIESDAVGIMTRCKEYGPGKVILSSPSLNSFLSNLHLDPWDKEKNRYRGVSFHEGKKRWRASLMFEGEEMKGDWFRSMVDAWVERLEMQLQVLEIWIQRLRNSPRKFCAKPELMTKALDFERIRLECLISNNGGSA